MRSAKGGMRYTFPPYGPWLYHGTFSAAADTRRHFPVSTNTCAWPSRS